MSAPTPILQFCYDMRNIYHINKLLRFDNMSARCFRHPIEILLGNQQAIKFEY